MPAQDPAAAQTVQERVRRAAADLDGEFSQVRRIEARGLEALDPA